MQLADAAGRVTFTSIFPPCYDVRWPHIHFEVYPDQASQCHTDTATPAGERAALVGGFGLPDL